MAKTKLYHFDTLKDGTKRFQTQLMVGKGSVADFIMGNDNIMKAWGYGEQGAANFYPYDGEFEIIENISEMRKQQL